MIPLPNLSASTSVSGKSGDAGGTSDVSFNYNGAFNVGEGTQDAAASQSNGTGSNNTLLYVALAVVGLVGVGVLMYARRP